MSLFDKITSFLLLNYEWQVLHLAFAESRGTRQKFVCCKFCKGSDVRGQHGAAEAAFMN
ncbi:hypothetical protein BRYFOR_07890 [Marvinbryantia formatexigens DSM 14469]|uniref:Uncharacterized protein n=1 Tax=Marvinbryantia formatexigens DSM 14469 TaxID=478749 RepID=C6LGY0_9FIRM|nr:hypothetical protein BRYFOR_07890 [Marvinbryantia formatexigens DSM 14469]